MTQDAKEGVQSPWALPSPESWGQARCLEQEAPFLLEGCVGRGRLKQPPSSSQPREDTNCQMAGLNIFFLVVNTF